MSLHPKHFKGSDSRTSDHNTDPSLNCHKNGQEDTLIWNVLDALKTNINKVNSDFDRKHQKLRDQIRKLNSITDDLESMHRKTTVGSLTGATLGAVGGITSIVGLCLAPVTFGASLIVTGVGAAVGLSGGVTGATSSIINNIQQKKFRQTIEEITSDFQNTTSTMVENIITINDSTEDIQKLVQSKMNYIPERMMGKAKGSILGLTNTEVSENSQDQVVKAVAWCKQAATGVQMCSGIVGDVVKSLEPAKKVTVTSGTVTTARLTGQTAKAVHAAVAVSGVISALFLVFDVVCIVQDSIEISEMNQSADKRNDKNIKSNTLKFIQQMRETAACFQKTLDEIKDAKDAANKEFKEKLSSARQGPSLNNSIFCLIISLVLAVFILHVLGLNK